MLRRFALALAMLAVATTCGDPGTTRPDAREGRRASSADVDPTLTWLDGYLASPPTYAPAAGEPAVLAGAGDIARCYPGSNVRAFQRPGPSNPADSTARLLDGMPGATVMAVGDNAYEFGSPLDYIFCYHPTWGRHRARTRPSAGNHEYLTPGALGYFAYFGWRAAPPLGYYSYELGSWHVVVLNSTPQVYACWPPDVSEQAPPGFPTLPQPLTPGPAAGRACAGDVAQQAWLAADLAAHRDAACTIAYFHHPRFSSGMHGNHYQMQKIWDMLYTQGADIVVSGHDHLYERFAPQTPDAERDDARGIRQFTVGTGGAELYPMGVKQPNSEVFINTAHGVLTLALDAGRYAWAFVAADGTRLDEGSSNCH